MMLNRKLSAINFKDLIFAILYTLVLSIAFGILLGYLDYYLITTINFTFIGFLYWIIAVYIGIYVRKSVEEPHLVYTLIAFLGMVFSWMIINTVPYLLMSGVTLQDYQIFLNIQYYFQVLLFTLNPVTGITSGFLNYIITIIIFGVGTYLGIARTLK